MRVVTYMELNCMWMTLVVYHLIGEYTPAIGDRVAHAFPVEGIT